MTLFLVEMRRYPPRMLAWLQRYGPWLYAASFGFLVFAFQRTEQHNTWYWHVASVAVWVPLVASLTFWLRRRRTRRRLTDQVAGTQQQAG